MKKYKIITRLDHGGLWKTIVIAESREEIENCLGNIVHISELPDIRFRRLYDGPLNDDDRKELNAVLYGTDET